MDYTIISDVHGRYNKFAPSKIAGAKVLLIAGDITNLGDKNPAEVNAAKKWLEKLKERYEQIFYIFGNHDLGLSYRDFDSFGVTCVQDKPTEFSGEKYLGANLSVCYNLPELKRYWTNMTDNPALEASYYDSLEPCDILLSHSPPSGSLAVTTNGEQCGSVKLREYIERVQPKLVVCGHIHEAAGSEYIGKTLVINTAQRAYYLEGVPECNTKKKKNR